MKSPYCRHTTAELKLYRLPWGGNAWLCEKCAADYTSRGHELKLIATAGAK